MNYYPFHVGDYAAHTAHLEPMEDLAYRRLLDQYYLRECPLPADIQATAKLVRMRSCVADVEAVLNEFFVLTEDGWKHSRCDAEIERMQDKQAKARASAQASVNARKAKSLNVRSTDGSDESSERSTDAEKKQTDVELPTPTPTPIEERDKSLLSPELPATADGAEIETHEAQTQPGAERLPNCPHDELLSLFAKHLPTLPRPKLELWDGARAEALRARWRWVLTAKKGNGQRYATNRAEALAWFSRFFAYVAESDFLTGRDGQWGKCDLGWLVKADNFAKVVQGNYENREAA